MNNSENRIQKESATSLLSKFSRVPRPPISTVTPSAPISEASLNSPSFWRFRIIQSQTDTLYRCFFTAKAFDGYKKRVQTSMKNAVRSREVFVFFISVNKNIRQCLTIAKIEGIGGHEVHVFAKKRYKLTVSDSDSDGYRSMQILARGRRSYQSPWDGRFRVSHPGDSGCLNRAVQPA